MSAVLTWMANHWALVVLGVLLLIIGSAVLFAWWIFNTNDDEHGDW